MSHLNYSKLFASGGWLVALIMLVVMLSLFVSTKIKTMQESLKPKPPVTLPQTLSSPAPLVKCSDMCINGYVYLVFSYAEGPYQTAPIAITPVYDQITKPQALVPRKCPKGLEDDKGVGYAK